MHRFALAGRPLSDDLVVEFLHIPWMHDVAERLQAELAARMREPHFRRAQSGRVTRNRTWKRLAHVCE
jgi:hypothetical protein